MVSRSNILVPEFYRPYVEKSGSDDLQKALRQNSKAFRKLVKAIPGKKIDYAYAEGKWTIRELLQHIIDCERVFALRALWFARQDPAPLPGFDENHWAAHTDVSRREWDDLVEEFFQLRRANEKLFASLSDEQLMYTGTANNSVANVATLGYVCAGHVAHHMGIIQERYLNKKNPGAAKKKKTNGKKREKPANQS